MKFKIDENLPAELAERLRDLGEDADTVVEEGLAGAPDSRIVVETRRERRVLITLDKGLGDVRTRSEDEPAVVLIRFPSAGRTALLDFVTPLLPGLALRLRSGSYRVLVITERGVRAR